MAKRQNAFSILYGYTIYAAPAKSDGVLFALVNFSPKRYINTPDRNTFKTKVILNAVISVIPKILKIIATVTGMM